MFGALTTGQQTQLTRAADVTALGPGTYTGTLTVTAAGAINSPQSVIVQLLVGAFRDSIRISSLTVVGQEHVSLFQPGPLTVHCDVEYDLRSDPKGGAVALFAFDTTRTPAKELAEIFPVPVDPTTKVETLAGLELKFEVPSDAVFVRVVAVLVASGKTLVTDKYELVIEQPFWVRMYETPLGYSADLFTRVLSAGLSLGEQASGKMEVWTGSDTGGLPEGVPAAFFAQKQVNGNLQGLRKFLGEIKFHFGTARLDVSSLVVPDDADQWVFYATTKVGDTEVQSHPLTLNIDRVRVIANNPPQNSDLTRGDPQLFNYTLEYNANLTGRYQIVGYLSTKSGTAVNSGTPIVSVDVQPGKAEVTAQFSVTPEDAATRLAITFVLVYTDSTGKTSIQAFSQPKVYPNVKSPVFTFSPGTTQTASALGIDLHPVQNGISHLLGWKRVAKTGSSLVKDFGKQLKLNLEVPQSDTFIFSKAASTPAVQGFIGIQTTWEFDPPIVTANASDFSADLTFHYDPAEFPDDPNFSEANLKVVSIDTSTGKLEVLATTLDRNAHTATARVIGLKTLYTLGVVGPFTKQTLNFPLVQSAGTTFTGFGLLNLGTAPSGLTLTAYGGKGETIAGTGVSNPASRNLAPGQQLAPLFPQLFNIADGSGPAWVQVRGDGTSVVGFELVGNAQRLDGIDALASLAPAVVLPEAELNDTYTTEVDISNPGNLPIGLNLELRSSTGDVAGTYDTVLAPKGKLVGTLLELFPSLMNPFTGYVIARGDADIVAAELVVSDQSMAALNGQPLPDAAAGPVRLFSAQLATGGGAYYTRLNVVNPTQLTATITVHAVSESGSNLASPVTFSLPAGQQYRREVGQIFGLPPGTLTVGSVVIDSSTTGVIGSVTFGDPSTANMFRASLPLDSAPATFGAFAQVANGAGYFTGAAAFNPNTVGANVTVKVFRADGTLTGSTQFPLPPSGRFSKLLPQLVPVSNGQVGGYFTIESDQPLTSFALFGTTNLSALSAVPAQRRASSP